jgi:hypothetical protein
VDTDEDSLLPRQLKLDYSQDLNGCDDLDDADSDIALTATSKKAVKRHIDGKRGDKSGDDLDEADSDIALISATKKSVKRRVVAKRAVSKKGTATQAPSPRSVESKSDAAAITSKKAKKISRSRSTKNGKKGGQNGKEDGQQLSTEDVEMVCQQ